MAMAFASFYISRQFHHICQNATASKSNVNKLVRIFHSSTTLKNNAIDSKLHSFFSASDKKVNRLQLKDNVSKNYTLIYNAPMELYMKFGYPLTFAITSGAPALMFYDFYVQGQIFLQKEANSLQFFNPEQEIWIFGGAMFLFAWALFAVLFKYPIRVYKRKGEKKYLAIYLSPIPLRQHHYHFQTATRKKFRNPFFFFIDKDCHYFLDDKKKAILFGHYFRTPADLSEMEDQEPWQRL